MPVTAVRVWPVALLTTSTVAPGTTLPDVSLTTPLIPVPAPRVGRVPLPTPPAVAPAPPLPAGPLPPPLIAPVPGANPSDDAMPSPATIRRARTCPHGRERIADLRLPPSNHTAG